MKKYVTIVLFIFWAIVVSLFVAGLFFYQKENQPAGATTSQSGTKVGNGKILNQAQLALHSTADNCWFLISGKIYDVSGYPATHPEGADIMYRYCGADATLAYATRGGGGNDHSSYAYNLLGNYYIGDLEQEAAPAITSTPATDPKTTTDDNQYEDNNDDSDDDEFDDLSRPLKVI